ncbi:MAG: hypothetical protein KAS32_05920 [Candidatus Peribacteraceae bacterium]|nr:hypothetical protein [Candidatus Peribacteraceae bacterium]
MVKTKKVKADVPCPKCEVNEITVIMDKETQEAISYECEYCDWKATKKELEAKK